MLNKVFILIILMGILPLNGNSQGNFSAEDYIQFLKDNKDLEDLMLGEVERIIGEKFEI